MKRDRSVVCFLVAVFALPVVLKGDQSLVFKRVSAALVSPVFATYAPGDFQRLFIVQRGGQIRILDLTDDTLNGTDFITIPDVLSGGEQGLLGLTFHPDYQNNGFFYVNFTDTTGGDTRIMRFSRGGNADTGNPNSGVLLLEIDQPQTNHNGGWIGFGPDGYLYIATGDGGNFDDTGTGHTAGTGNAQDITSNLLGKMLRVDVDGDDFPADPNRNYAIPPTNPYVGINGDDEIFLYGLRNPWRCSFDRLTNDLYIGDVGQDQREEIDVRFHGSSGNRNYGWRLREGMIATPNVGGAPPADNVNPIYNYPHTGGNFGGFCVTGGYVYRGPIVDLRGHYFFADYISDRLWSLKFDGSPENTFNGTNYNALVDWTLVLDTDIGIMSNFSSFGEDAAGNLYVCDLGGELFRLESGNISTSLGVIAINALRGFHISGGLAEIENSDNTYLRYRQGITFNVNEPPVWIEFFGISPDSDPAAVSFDIESNSNTAGIRQTIELYNYTTDSYDIVDQTNISTVDQTVTVELEGDGGDYVFIDGSVRARIGWKPNGPIFLFPWQINIDKIAWRVVE
jgi:glucose/arabinose dehydrogenase